MKGAVAAPRERGRMKFDSNRAWQEATAAVAANRDVLLALAGAFFLLPSLAISLLFPQPEPAAGQTEQQIFAMAQGYMIQVMPFMLAAAVVQATGTLAMLTLFTDRTRPTVGQAIRQGAAGLATYLVAQVLVGVALALIGGLVISVAAAIGAPVIAALGVAGVVVLAVYAFVKASLAAPIVAVERVRNPIAALQRSWRLTKGNSVRLGLFYLLVAVAFMVVMMLVMAVIGVVLSLLAGAGAAKTVGAVLSAGFGSVMTLYFVAILAAAHRQLAGPSAEAAGAPFE